MESEPGFDIPEILKGRYKEDDFFKHIIQKPSHHKDFTVENGLVFLTAGKRKELGALNSGSFRGTEDFDISSRKCLGSSETTMGKYRY